MAKFILPANEKEVFLDFLMQTKDPEIKASITLILDVMRLPGSQEKYNKYKEANKPQEIKRSRKKEY